MEFSITSAQLRDLIDAIAYLDSSQSYGDNWQEALEFLENLTSDLRTCDLCDSVFHIHDGVYVEDREQFYCSLDCALHA